MKEMITELVEYRQLLYILAWRDIKIRYKQSVMGLMWAILMPMLIVAAGLLMKLAFSFVSGKSMDSSDLASIMVKALPWSLFITSIKSCTNSLTGNSNLVTKIFFPREILPGSAILANLFDFMVAALTLSVILVFMNTGISIYLFWLPLLFVLLLIFTAGVGMFLACANLFFRDVKYIVDVILTFAIFFTPVFYDASMFGKWEPLFMLNPVGAILESIKAVVILHQSPDMTWLAYSAASSISVLMFSWVIFHRAEFMFAERI